MRCREGRYGSPQIKIILKQEHSFKRFDGSKVAQDDPIMHPKIMPLVHGTCLEPKSTATMTLGLRVPRTVS